MNKKEMITTCWEEVQRLNRRIDSLETQLDDVREARNKLADDLYAEIRNNTELNLPVPGMQTLSVPGDPQGRRYVKIVDLMLAMLKHVGLTLEYDPGRYTLKESRKKERVVK